MQFHPGALLGIPEGWPQSSDVGALRWALLGLSWIWAALSLRGRPVLSLIAGVAFGSVAVGFWVLAFGRPYGLLIDPAITLHAADAAVVAASEDAVQGAIVGTSPSPGLLLRLARLGLAPPLLLLLPTLLPLLAHVAVAVVVALLAPRPRSWLAASLWLAFPASTIELIRGDSFLSAPWRRPEGFLGIAAVVGVLLLLSRARHPARLAVPAAIVLAASWAAMIPRVVTGEQVPLALLRALTLDQGLFFLLAVAGLRSGADAASRMLLMTGLLLRVAASVLAIDPWCGQALFRLGILMAACGPIEELERRAGARLQRIGLLAPFRAPELARALLLALAVPASALAWWNPIYLDGPVGERSLTPLPQALLEAMDWIRLHTDPRKVFVASSEYAPAVAALAGRHVLRAPTLALPSDTVRRRAQKAALEGRADPALARFRVGYVLVGPGDAERWRLPESNVAVGRRLRPLFRGARGHFYVFALAPR